jgi:magnesium transporter
MIRCSYGRHSGSGAIEPVDVEKLNRREVRGFDLLWVDVSDPTSRDLALLSAAFGFHPLALEDAERLGQRAKVDQYDDHYFLVIHAARSAGSAGITTAELQLFWSPRVVVTIHRGPFPEIDQLAETLERRDLEGLSLGRAGGPTAGHLVYRLLDSVVDGYFPMIDDVVDRVESIEDQMFEEKAGESTLASLFQLKKDLLHVRRMVAPSRDVINVLLRRDRALYEDGLAAYFQDVYDHTVRVIDSLDAYRELLSTSVDIYLSMASNGINRTVKRMTAVTAILMIVTLVASVYGMNFTHMPELGWELGYPWALGLMAVLATFAWALFKKIDWL